MNETKTIEKTSSISLSRTSKGAYSWDIKLYYDKDTEKSETIISEIEKINNDIKKTFEEK